MVLAPNFFYTTITMHTLFTQTFPSVKPCVIGMVHFSALDGYADCPGKEEVLRRAIFDLEILLAGGVDAVMFENNFDDPKYEKLPPAAAAHFSELVGALVARTNVPWGISALWNDYELGFALCAQHGGVMVRVPVFVDSVETTYGNFFADPARVLTARKNLGAENVALLADVQVKHARMLEPRPLADSVAAAVEAGADGIIITGKWTGDPPQPADCELAKSVAAGRAAILTGSGMTAENVAGFAPFLDGLIVGTAFKEGVVDTGLRHGPNIVEQERRYDVEKVKKIMAATQMH